jgi:O-antigen/teichoic acid export membrane protein
MTAATATGADPIGDRRRLAARGTLINSAFQIGLGGLTFLKAIVAARFVSTADYGVWGILFLALAVIVSLKTVGVTDKYIQQDEEDHEGAFQRAFTLELLFSLILTVAMIAAAPLIALAYGRQELFLPALAIALVIPSIALQSPLWIFYRRMDFVRERSLSAIEPIVSFVLTIVLAVAGFGYWALIIGFVAGSWSSAIAALIASPYPIRVSYDHGTMREYFTYSWPLMLAGISGLLIAQFSVFFGTIALGLAGAGAISLAGNFSSYADRVDAVVTQTIYPAICRVRHNRDLLLEAFTKSNRLALMWGIPFGIALTLFAGDLIQFGIGEKWDLALVLLQVMGVTAALNHVGFNWSAFYRAIGNTRPMAVVTVGTAAVFFAVPVPLLLTEGLTGFAIGIGVMTAATLAMRAYYVAKLFPRFAMLGYLVRAVAPTVPAVGVVLLLRTAESGPRSLGLALAELAVYIATTAAFTLAFERSLIREVLGYLRGEGRRAAVAGA